MSGASNRAADDVVTMDDVDAHQNNVDAHQNNVLSIRAHYEPRPRDIEPIRGWLHGPLARAMADIRTLIAACDASKGEAERLRLLEVAATQRADRQREQAERSQAWIDAHECEDVASGALDAQAEAEKQMFKARRERDRAFAEVGEVRAALMADIAHESERRIFLEERQHRIKRCLRWMVSATWPSVGVLRGMAEGLLGAMSREDGGEGESVYPCEPAAAADVEALTRRAEAAEARIKAALEVWSRGYGHSWSHAHAMKNELERAIRTDAEEADA